MRFVPLTICVEERDRGSRQASSYRMMSSGRGRAEGDIKIFLAMVIAMRVEFAAL